MLAEERGPQPACLKLCVHSNQNAGTNQAQKCVKVMVKFIVTSSEAVKLLEPTALSGILYAKVGKQILA